MTAYDVAVDNTTAPLYHWKLGEANGSGTVADRKGNYPVALTVDSGVTLGTTGVVQGNSGDTAATFPATSTSDIYGASGSRPTINATTFTWVAWIKIDATNALTGDQYIAAFFQGNSPSHSGIFLRGNKAGVYFNYSGGYREAVGATNLTAGGTYRLCGTYDGTTLTIRINSVSDGTLSTTSTPVGSAQSAVIGNTWALTGAFKGVIDEVAFYTSAITGTKDAAEYTAGTTSGTNQTLAGTIANTQAVTGALAVKVGLTGAIPTIVALTGQLAAHRGLAGQIATTTTLTGALQLTRGLAGQISHTTQLTGELVVTRGLAGQIAATTTATAQLTADRGLAGSIPTSSDAQADLKVQYALAGEIPTTVTLTGSLTGTTPPQVPRSRRPTRALLNPDPRGVLIVPVLTTAGVNAHEGSSTIDAHLTTTRVDPHTTNTTLKAEEKGATIDA